MSLITNDQNEFYVNCITMYQYYYTFETVWNFELSAITSSYDGGGASSHFTSSLTRWESTTAFISSNRRAENKRILYSSFYNIVSTLSVEYLEK